MARSNVVLVVAALAAGAVNLTAQPARAGDPRPVDEPRSILAAFSARSYAPGDVAELRVWSTEPGAVTVTIHRVGPERARFSSRNAMFGVPVRTARPLSVVGSDRVSVPVGNWTTGLYFARLVAPGGRIGFAPFVVRPSRLGLHRVAVVLPTNTWQAYNFRDVDGNGVGDTWYANPRIPVVDLARPYMHRGVPPYRPAFMRWVTRARPAADFFSDDDLDAVSNGDALARAYDLVVFAGHEEYVTTHMYDLVTRYRDLGGNLAFLSSNSFFYRVAHDRNTIRRTGRWIDLGRVDARLTGVSYVGWNQGRYPNRPYVVAGADRAPWFYAGTGLRNGDTFGFAYGIEIDSLSRNSPRGTVILARIPGIFGPGRNATMTFYKTARGAKVFAAGAMNFDSPQSRVAAQLLRNLWAELSSP